jgi:hypothetical protein
MFLVYLNSKVGHAVTKNYAASIKQYATRIRLTVYKNLFVRLVV